MITKEKILEIAKQKGKIGTTDLSKRFSVSRQYLNRLIKELVETGKLIKLGATRYAFYVLPEYAQKHKEIFPLRYRKTFKNISLEEHKVLDQVEQTFPPLKNLPESVHISRSQARRVLSGLEKFKIIVFDFDKVPVAGQAFADEIFRVFHNKHPHITLDAVNMNEGVKFMVERARNEAEALGS